MLTRFAPSPTGRLHLGHAFAALTVWDAARAAGGRVLLRIEDIDATRCRPEFEAGIYEDLAWLGLEWEAPVRRQSEHVGDYLLALERLREDGLLYRDFRSEDGARRSAENANVLRLVSLQQLTVDSDSILHSCWKLVLRSEPVQHRHNLCLRHGGDRDRFGQRA